MARTNHQKTEICVIKSHVDYLVQYSQCTREKALIALCKNGLIKGTFKTIDIQEILQIGYKTVDSASRTAEFKINQLVNRVFFDEFKESLLMIDARNYEYCTTNV